MAKPKKRLSEEEIERGKQELEKKINEYAEIAKGKRRVGQTTLLLVQIKDMIEKAIRSGMSYQMLAEQISDVYNYKVTTQAIGTFVREHLGIRRNGSSKSAKGGEKKS